MSASARRPDFFRIDLIAGNVGDGRVAIVLPLAQSASGTLRASKVKLGFKARSSDRRADADVVVLQCLPAS